MKLLEPDFVKKLEYLSIISKKTFQGSIKGEHKSKKKGVSPEFADYRNYSAGDDLRYVDWNLYGRLEKLFLKLFVEEEDLYIYILLDNSKSMDYGSPNKLEYSTKLTAALGYIILTNMNRLGLITFDNTIRFNIPPVRGKGQFFNLLHHLEQIKATEGTNINEALKLFTIKASKPGIVILISDFLDEKGYEEGIKYLIYKKYEPFIIQIFSPQEMEPDIYGNVKLIDIETNRGREITVSQEIINIYKSNVNNFIDTIRKFCLKNGCHHIFNTTSYPFDSLIMDTLRKGELLK